MSLRLPLGDVAVVAIFPAKVAGEDDLGKILRKMNLFCPISSAVISEVLSVWARFNKNESILPNLKKISRIMLPSVTPFGQKVM